MADLLDVGVLFAVIALAGMVASAVDKSVIPFYIVAGMTFSESVVGRAIDALSGTPAGPFVEGRLDVLVVEASEFVEIGAELGIVFLLFFLGLEFHLDRLLDNRRQIGTAGTIDLAINFGAGLVLGWVLFGDLLGAFLTAGIVYISSSAIVTKSLIDLGWIANDEASPMLGTLVYEDLFVAVYLAVATALLTGRGGLTGAAVSTGVAIAFILALLVVVYFGTALFERTLATGSREFLVLRTVGITVLIAGAALAVGVSEAVAAFFVGMAFASTSKVDQLDELLEPVRDTFAAVFFFWIGVVTDPTLLPAVAVPILVAVVVTTPTKLVSGYLAGRAYGLDSRRSTRVGLGMVARGEFSLIIATLALGSGALPGDLGETLYAFAVGYVLAMSILGTVLMQYSGPFERAVVDASGRF